MELISGYKIPYEPWAALERLKSDREAALDELWENLYHQGDVDTASYAAVPQLVENEVLDLVAAIEVARNNGASPIVPSKFESKYKQALQDAVSRIPKDLSQLKAYYAIHASLNGQYSLAKVLDFISVEEVLSEIE
ncbi:hypothetical protein QWY82_18420 [Simiduia curdlanivorans]|uniref:Uncharacterized protein n=1 Tax=Simiduia curdlanivorans TaxID=1492769 RepID=A0ABV8V718_9GAMM|nr:hypothetical protein [Simiduia curdlanivorans]MDN3640780.1 hypothetical protein [Simiduia curdlanivorans]